ncbi:MAG: lysylphosphatidylglycerol synthase transmembrane domain-containing protein [Acidobacteriota bacterium]
MKKHHLGLIVVVGLLIVGGMFLYARVQQSGFAWDRFVDVLSQVSRPWLAAAVPLILASYVVRAVRWQVMVRPMAPLSTLWELTTATFIGFTAMVFFGRAGEPVRPYLIARKYNIAFSTQVAAWLVERILDLLMILALFGFSLAHATRGGAELPTGVKTAGWIAGMAAAACFAAIIALRRYRGHIRTRLEEATTFLPDAFRQRILGFIHAFDEGMQSTRDPASLWLLVFYTLLEWTFVAATCVVIFQAFPAVRGLGIPEVLTVLGVVTFAGIVQIPGVGGGVQLATVLVLTEMYGVELEAASGISLVLWAFNYLVAVPVGLVLAFREGIQWRNMRHVGDENPLGYR